MGPAGLAGIAGALTVVFVLLAVASTILPIVALAYVALRVQDARQAEPDPRLGMKTAFHTVHTISVLIVLAGLSVFMIDLMQGALGGNKPNLVPPPNPFGGAPAGPGRAAKADGFNTAQRVAVALVISGLLFGVSFWAFLVGTNDAARRSVRRVFVGGRMALCLLVTVVTVTGLLIVLLQKEPQHDITEALVAMLVVWFPAACVHMVLFFTNMSEPRAGRRRRDRDDEEERGWQPADD